MGMRRERTLSAAKGQRKSQSRDDMIFPSHRKKRVSMHIHMKAERFMQTIWKRSAVLHKASIMIVDKMGRRHAVFVPPAGVEKEILSLH